MATDPKVSDDILEQIERDQGYHPPDNPAVGELLAKVRAGFMDCSYTAAVLCPDNPHFRRALELIDAAQMYAIKACVTDQAALIAKHGLGDPS